MGKCKEFFKCHFVEDSKVQKKVVHKMIPILFNRKPLTKMRWDDLGRKAQNAIICLPEAFHSKCTFGVTLGQNVFN